VTIQRVSPNQQSNITHKPYCEDCPLSKGERFHKEIRKVALSEVEQPLTNDLFSSLTEGNTMLREDDDEVGLPVTGDSDTQKQEIRINTDFFSVLWHELLTPLNLIKGYTATLLQLNNSITKDQRGKYLLGIDSASNKVVHLLENLRDISELEESPTIATQPISLLMLLRQSVSDMQSQTEKHVIKLRPYAPLPHIKVEPEKIDQVISNLLTNAVKYSPQGGDILVEIRAARSDRELARLFGETPPLKLPCMIVSVADNGIGIPESELDRIFEKFYRLSNKLTRTTHGSGLGLYICKIIVEAHGGHIWARNRLQGGSIFSFSLPFDVTNPRRL
jgi:signal transduction histidine kinase